MDTRAKGGPHIRGSGEKVEAQGAIRGAVVHKLRPNGSVPNAPHHHRFVDPGTVGIVKAKPHLHDIPISEGMRLHRAETQTAQRQVLHEHLSLPAGDFRSSIGTREVHIFAVIPASFEEHLENRPARALNPDAFSGIGFVNPGNLLGSSAGITVNQRLAVRSHGDFFYFAQRIKPCRPVPMVFPSPPCHLLRPIIRKLPSCQTFFRKKPRKSGRTRRDLLRTTARIETSFTRSETCRHALKCMFRLISRRLIA